MDLDSQDTPTGTHRFNGFEKLQINSIPFIRDGYCTNKINRFSESLSLVLFEAAICAPNDCALNGIRPSISTW